MPKIEDLAWLTGDWEGTLAGGAVFNAHYTGAHGGVILSVSKEIKQGRVVSYELEHFSEKNGVLVYAPHPNGRRSRDFPLVAYDAAKQRAEFENLAHDFPQRFVFERRGPDNLIIVLSGPGADGKRREITYDLRAASVR